MPLIHSESAKHASQIAIWEIHENLRFFKEKLELSPEDSEFLANIHERRAVEWAASRYLLKTILDRSIPFECIADEHGKPYIPDDPRHISISHSWGMAMVGLSDGLIGVDVQRESEKVSRIHHKFIAPEDYPDGVEVLPTDTMHLAWSAKEALYKLFGKGEVDFRKHLRLELPADIDRYGKITGYILKDGQQLTCEIKYRFFRGYIWVYALPV